MQQWDYINFSRLCVKCNNQLGLLCMQRSHPYARHTHHFFQFLSNYLACRPPWYLDIKHNSRFSFYHSSYSFEHVASGEVLHLRSILSLKLQQPKSVQSCFTMSGIIETELHYYLSNYFCEGQTIKVRGDIEALKFSESENNTSLYRIGGK